MKRTLTFLLAAAISFSCFAQGDKKDDNTSYRDKVLAAKIAYFTSEIGLTPEEAQVFWPLYNKYWGETQNANRMTRESFDAIKKLDDKGGYSDIDMKKLVNKYIDNYVNESELCELYLSEFYKILPVSKVAKFYLAEEGFRNKLTEMWKEQRRQEKKAKADNPQTGKKPEPYDDGCEDHPAVDCCE